MRHIRARRRFRLTLTVLFTASFILFLENRVESFTPAIRHVVEARVGEAFDKNLELSIGDLDGGILRPFVLSDVKLKYKKGSGIFSYFEIKNLKSNYRIWDIVFRSRPGLLGFLFPPSVPYVQASFATKNNELTGLVIFKGDVKNARISGYVNLFGNEKRYRLAGHVRSGAFTIELSERTRSTMQRTRLSGSRTGGVKIEGGISSDGYVEASVRINHLRINDLEVACDIAVKSMFLQDPLCSMKDYLEGDVKIRNLILNDAPPLGISASYKISNGILEIPNLAIDNGFRMQGKILLAYPYSLSLVCLADNVNLNRVLACLDMQDEPFLSGIMNGKFEISGPMARPRSAVHIEVRSGRLGPVDFDYLVANLKGEGSMVRIEDSRITRESGYFALAGEIDMSKLGKAGCFQDIKLSTDDKAIIWDKWSAEKIQGVEEIQMKKKMSENINLGFKKFMPGKMIDESLRDHDEYELEYKIFPNQSLKMTLGNDKDFFGFEHKDKF